MAHSKRVGFNLADLNVELPAPGPSTPPIEDAPAVSDFPSLSREKRETKVAQLFHLPLSLTESLRALKREKGIDMSAFVADCLVKGLHEIELHSAN